MNRIASLAAGVFVVATTFPALAQQPSTVPQVRADSPRVVLQTPTTRFATIQGAAMRASRGAGTTNTVNPLIPPDADTIPNILVRLRDARYGRSVDTQFTDRSGAFVFRAVDPGNYMVEIVSKDQTAIAATQLISANAGETINAVVRLPNGRPGIGALLGEQGVTAVTNTPGVVSGLVPTVLEQLPLAILQTIPAVVAIAPAASER